MAPSQPGQYDDRKGSAGSSTARPVEQQPGYAASSASSTNAERRPSAGSGYFSLSHNGRMNSDHGSVNSSSSINILARSPDDRDRQRAQNTRTHLEAQSPVAAGAARRKHHKDGNESNSLLSFFRSASSSSSRPPSPDLLDTLHSASHTRKTSFSSRNDNDGSHGRNIAMSGSAGSIVQGQSNGVYNGSSSYNGSGTQQYSNLQGRTQKHPFDADSVRRRSIESYSRTPSPDVSAEQPEQRFVNGIPKHLFPSTPPSHLRTQQRSDSIRNAIEAQHRRTKSTDHVDTLGKRSGQQDQDSPSHVASPAKETKKTLFGFLKKKTHLPHHGHGSPQPQQAHQQQHYSERSRKSSADDQFMSSPATTSTLHAFSMALFPDHENGSHHGQFDKRHGSDGGDSQKGLQYMTGGKKAWRRDLVAQQQQQQHQDALLPGFVVMRIMEMLNTKAAYFINLGALLVDLNDMSGIKQDPKLSHWLPLSAAGAGALTPEDESSEELDQSDLENWDYGKKKLSTIRIFRPDTTYTTVNCVFNIAASELSAILGKKIFKPDTSKYHLYVLRNNISTYTKTRLWIRNLRELVMAYNDLDKVPSNIRYITNLQVLDLRGNRIRDLSKARLEDARVLVTLYLQSNRLESFPDSFQAFEYLRVLNLSSNNFSKLPPVLLRITTLEDLDVSFNEITEVPEDIGRLSRLRTLLLFGNRIGPFLPKSMSDLVRLRKLDIRQNGILNLDAVNDLPSLEELLVDYNTNVVLNNSFKSLTSISLLKCNMTDMSLRGAGSTLIYLDASSNRLSNLAPSLFEHLLSVETLKLDNNSISSIPGTIGLLKRLKFLSVSNNLLSSLPDEVGQLESLLELDVHSNNLGELPVSVWKCSLITLNASSNLLEYFPDPPKTLAVPTPLNAGQVSSSSSVTTLCDENGAPSSSNSTTAPIPARSKPLPAPPVPLQSIPSARAPYSPPLANSLQTLSLADNRLPDEVLYPLSYFNELLVLNLSHNYIAEIPRGKIPNPGQIVELYLSGNQLTSLPAEDIERLRSLLVLHVNGNKLTTLPAELGKINRLMALDVGCNMLKYNISNWPYDWNWNWNLELKYLNMSGNKRLQIKRQNVEGIPNLAARPGNLSEFGNLTRLRILGLMDVTITDNVPENSVDRRVRTSMSTLHNMAYGMADTLGDSDNLCIWDLVHPKFQTKEDESLFGLFDGRGDRYRANCSMTSYLKDRFGSCLKIELEKLEGTDTVVSALRRTFLGLDRDLWPLTQDEDGKGGASALVAYIKGVTLYCANVGDAIAVLVKKSDTYQVVSQKHIPWNPTEASRIKRSGGFVSENGLLNGELDISRSFGQYHLVPIVNSNPYIETTTLSEDDDFLIMASNAFWDVMSYTTAVDIAKAAKRDYGDLMYASQKLRDIAISYGARDHMVVMLIGVGDLFKKKEPSDMSEYRELNYKRPKVPEGPADALKYLKPEIEPPQGDVAMVFTDIKNSTKLWENIPKAMAIAIKEHFNVMRRQLRSIGGYEVKNEGDALMASFSSVPAAMLWCFKVQELLVMADWPQDILDSNECKAIFNAADPNQPMYRGLSVRMGIHWGRPVSDRDAVTRRMDYYGPMVNRAARICDSADGGEICVSSDVINVMQHLLTDPELEESDSPHAEHVRELKKMGFGVIELGEKKLKGLETPENLHLIYSRLLAGRLAMDPLKGIPGTPILETQLVESTVALDPSSVRALQMICLRLERLASGATAQHGRVSEQSLVLLSLPIKDNAEQDDLSRIAEHYITRIENSFSQLYMAKSGHFVSVFESLGRAIDTDPSYILRALQMYVSIMGGLDSPSLL
ncbi:cysteinyl-tRNA synthetase [Mortierella antarctica]|nr:cysteinyl-tRNA synthetase [Mortierella antarctica]